MKLTNTLTEFDERISALENTDLDENAPVARIVKQYGEFKISISIRTRVGQFLICSNTLFCSNNLII